MGESVRVNDLISPILKQGRSLSNLYKCIHQLSNHRVQSQQLNRVKKERKILVCLLFCYVLSKYNGGRRFVPVFPIDTPKGMHLNRTNMTVQQ